MNCRHCHEVLKHTFIDLGHAPPSNAYLTSEELSSPEIYFPLKLKVCSNCWLVQTEDYTRAEELFKQDYAYFSSTSSSWIAHAAHYTKMIVDRLRLNADSHVIEVASNDGYLLKNFISAGIPCLGVEPTDSTAEAAEKIGITVIRDFFGQELANQLVKEGKQADLVIGNNVLAHVPDLNDFTTGLKRILKPNGTITLEFPHILRLIEGIQFDTIYHEHFSYFSLNTVQRVLDRSGLKIWDVEELQTHGGSLRVYACHNSDQRLIDSSVHQLLEKERNCGLCDLSSYETFKAQVDKLKCDLLNFLLSQKATGSLVVGYGAAAKGNTLLNFAGVKPDLLPWICDAAVSKQGKFMPGSHIPIVPPSQLKFLKPKVVLILPWNISKEIVFQHGYIREWGGKFAIAVPRITFI